MTKPKDHYRTPPKNDIRFRKDRATDVIALTTVCTLIAIACVLLIYLSNAQISSSEISR